MTPVKSDVSLARRKMRSLERAAEANPHKATDHPHQTLYITNHPALKPAIAGFIRVQALKACNYGLYRIGFTARKESNTHAMARRVRIEDS